MACTSSLSHVSVYIAHLPLGQWTPFGRHILGEHCGTFVTRRLPVPLRVKEPDFRYSSVHLAPPEAGLGMNGDVAGILSKSPPSVEGFHCTGGDRRV